MNKILIIDDVELDIDDQGPTADALLSAVFECASGIVEQSGLEVECDIVHSAQGVPEKAVIRARNRHGFEKYKVKKADIRKLQDNLAKHKIVLKRKGVNDV